MAINAGRRRKLQPHLGRLPLNPRPNFLIAHLRGILGSWRSGNTSASSTQPLAGLRRRELARAARVSPGIVVAFSFNLAISGQRKTAHYRDVGCARPLTA